MQRCAEENFDLILMDGRMPVMDGLAAARAIRDGGLDGAWVLDPEIWMIALTANATGNDRELSLAAGMNDFLPKPVDERALALSLHRAVDALRARGRTLRPRGAERGRGRRIASRRSTPCCWTSARRRSRCFARRGGRRARCGAAGASPIRSLAERLREAFRAETPRLLADLSTALSAGDFAHAARIAHNIKGSAFYIQCEPMADHAAALENACDERDVEVVETHWVNLQGSIEAWITQN